MFCFVFSLHRIRVMTYTAAHHKGMLKTPWLDPVQVSNGLFYSGVHTLNRGGIKNKLYHSCSQPQSLNQVTFKKRIHIIPRERSFVWFVDRTTGRLARTRVPRVKPVGVSASDMASRDSREARERWSTWSPTLGCGLGPCFGLLLCRRRHMKITR